jgi:hypothetical protein
MYRPCLLFGPWQVVHLLDHGKLLTLHPCEEGVHVQHINRGFDALPYAAGQPFASELPKYALEALRPLLEVWERCGSIERYLRNHGLSREQLQAVSALESHRLPVLAAELCAYDNM